MGAKTSFHSFIKYSPAILYTAKADKNRSILSISPQVEKLLGFSDQEFLIDPDAWFRLIHPGDRGRVMDAVSKHCAGFEKVITEYRIYTRGGRLLHFHDQSVIIPGGLENPPYLQGIMLDITGLRNNECLLKGGMIISCELNCRSKTDKARVGLCPAGIIELNDIAEHKQMERELDQNRLEELVKERTAELVDANKNLQLEIDRREHAEKLLEVERNKLKSILDAMDDGVCMVSRNYDIEYVNPVIEREFGPVNGQKCYEYFHGNRKACRGCKSRDVFAGKSVRWEWYSPKAKKTYDLYDTPISNSDGSISKLEFFHDVTGRKKNEEILLDYQEKLRSMATELSMVEERERRRIATDIHDYISQSLAAAKIKLAAMTTHSALPPVAIDGLNQIGEFINEAIGYTQSLITDLSISTLHDIEFSEALEWLCNHMEDRHGIRINCQKNAEINPIGEEARVILIKSVRELLNNVVKHSAAKNVIISIRKASTKIYLTVEDDGIGFEIDEVKKRFGKNGGFGLFSIRESLDHLGGSITIRSGLGKGTAITLKAPLNTHRRGNSK